MRSVTYSMSVSLDGYIVGPDGGFDWTAPDAEVFRFWLDEIRQVGVHLLGRRLYETMLYWETAEQEQTLDEVELEWAAIWKALPKFVFSTTLSAVQGNARLVSGGLVEELERLRAEPGQGEIAIGGATLAAEVAAAGLVDEYRAMVYPVLVDGLPVQHRLVQPSPHQVDPDLPDLVDPEAEDLLVRGRPVEAPVRPDDVAIEGDAHGVRHAAHHEPPRRAASTGRLPGPARVVDPGEPCRSPSDWPSAPRRQYVCRRRRQWTHT